MDPKSKTIAGEQFTLNQPYNEGHTLTAIEAKVLNQVRHENIANNLRKTVKASIAGEEGAPTPAELDKIVAEYDSNYEFTLAGVGGSRKLDPVEREARAIARDVIKTKLAESGRKLADVDKDKLEAAIENLVENNEDIMKTAKKRVAEKNKVIDSSVAELDL